jgi:hypothetical protein
VSETGPDDAPRTAVHTPRLGEGEGDEVDRVLAHEAAGTAGGDRGADDT